MKIESTSSRHWSRALREIRIMVSALPRILVATDFDGTLSRLEDHAEDARPEPGAAEVLQRLAGMRTRVRLAALSGRSLGDLARRLGTCGQSMILSGNHGLEIQGGGLDYTHPLCTGIRPALEMLRKELREALHPLKGVEIEDKQLSLTLHYRRATTAAAEKMKNFVNRLKLPAGVRRHDGKMVIEFRPQVDWNKGLALQHIMQHLDIPPAATLYLGDDLTDEDAFCKLCSAGVSVHVGGSDVRTLAKWQAHDPADVVLFLQTLADILDQN